MQIKVLGSGSKGNCYILEHDGERLLLDAGIPFKQIKIGLDFNISNVKGALITHSHQDHLMSAKDLEFNGIDVWQPFIESETILKKKFGKFTVTCFPLEHDGVENRGFYIKAGDEKFIYMTDFEYCTYRFEKIGINHFLIECNHIAEYVDDDAENFAHVIRGHANLDVVKEFLAINKTDEMRNVILCHLSERNADEKQMIKEVKDIVGDKANVCIAEKGLEIEL